MCSGRFPLLKQNYSCLNQSMKAGNTYFKLLPYARHGASVFSVCTHVQMCVYTSGDVSLETALGKYIKKFWRARNTALNGHLQHREGEGECGSRFQRVQSMVSGSEAETSWCKGVEECSSWRDLRRNTAGRCHSEAHSPRAVLVTTCSTGPISPCTLS